MRTMHGGCELYSNESRHLREFLRCVKGSLGNAYTVEVDNGYRYTYGLYIEGSPGQLVDLLASLPGTIVKNMSGALWIILNGGSEVVIIREPKPEQ